MAKRKIKPGVSRHTDAEKKAAVKRLEAEEYRAIAEDLGISTATLNNWRVKFLKATPKKRKEKAVTKAPALKMPADSAGRTVAAELEKRVNDLILKAPLEVRYLWALDERAKG